MGVLLCIKGQPVQRFAASEKFGNLAARSCFTSLLQKNKNVKYAIIYHTKTFKRKKDTQRFENEMQ